MDFDKDFQKRKYPIAILKDLKFFYQFFQQSPHTITTTDECILLVMDNAPDSNFYFNIVEFKESFWRGLIYDVRISPYSRTKLGEQKYSCSKDEVIQKFREWHYTVKEYETIKFHNDEEITNAYQKEIIEEFKFEKEENNHPFPPVVQLALSKSIDSQIKYINDITNSNTITEEKKEKLNKIVDSFIDLNASLPKVSKKDFITEWSKIAANIKKLGAKIYKEAKTEIVKEAYKMIFRATVENWSHIQAQIGQAGSGFIDLVS